MAFGVLSWTWPCACPSKCSGSEPASHFITPPCLADLDVSCSVASMPEDLLEGVPLLLVLLEEPLELLLLPPQAATKAAAAAAPAPVSRARLRPTRAVSKPDQ